MSKLERFDINDLLVDLYRKWIATIHFTMILHAYMERKITINLSINYYQLWWKIDSVSAEDITKDHFLIIYLSSVVFNVEITFSI